MGGEISIAPPLGDPSQIPFIRAKIYIVIYKSKRERESGKIKEENKKRVGHYYLLP